MRHVHRFRRGGRFIEERCVGDLESGEIDDHLLEIEQRFQTTLRDLGLVRRVGRVPAGILEDIPLDHGRCDAVVVSLAEITFADPIPRRDLPQFLERLVFAFSFRKGERLSHPDAGGHRRLDERFQGSQLQRAQHLPNLTRIRADVTARKGIFRSQRGLGRRVGGENVVHRQRLEMDAAKSSRFEFEEAHPLLAFTTAIGSGGRPFAEQCEAAEE